MGGKEHFVFLHELIKQTQDRKTLGSELLTIFLVVETLPQAC
jgi:hypothetical protein